MNELLKEYFESQHAMQLATAVNGQPWLCTVYVVYDDAFHVYWMSDRGRRHSQEVRKNANVAMTLVRDAVHKRAVQLTGKAQEVEGDDLERVHRLYEARYGKKDYDLEHMQNDRSNGRSYWVFRPDVVEFWDEVQFPDAPKQRHVLIS